jgi:hypothetical protein
VRRFLGAVLVVLVAACGNAASAPPSSAPPTVAPPATIGPTPSSAVTAAPAPSPSSPPSAQPSPTPTPASASLTFARASTIDGAELKSVTAFDGGFVAGGCTLNAARRGCAEALLMHSTSGRKWTRADMAGGAGYDVLDVVVTPLGLLALASDFPNEPPRTRAMWRSDDGLRWERFEMPAPSPIVFEQAAVIGDRTVLFGSDTTSDLTYQTEVWVEDGGSWESGTTPLAAKIASHDGFVGIGDECRSDVCEDGLPLRVYRSPDGVTWNLESDDPPFADSDPAGSGTWNGRAVFLTSKNGDPDADVTVWIDQPQGWHGAKLDRSDGFWTQVVLDADGRLLVLGRRESDGWSAWWTDDGATWTRETIRGVDGSIITAAGADPIVLVVDYDTIWTFEQ